MRPGRWRPGRWLRGIAPAICLCALSTAAFAQRRVGFERWKASLEFGIKWNHQTTSNPPLEEADLRRRLLEESLKLGNYLYVIDPRFLSLGTDLDFRFFQDRLDIEGQGNPSDGKLVGHDVEASFFPSKPLSFVLFTNRSDTTISREFAGSSSVLSANRGATLHFRRFFLPSQVDYRQERLREESRFGGSVGRREEFRNLFTYDGSATSERNNVDLRYQYSDVEDLANPDFSFKTGYSTLFHRFIFGKAESKSLTTSVRQFTRTGRFDLTSLTADEILRLDHSERFATSYQYTFSNFATDSGTTSLNSGLVWLRHQLYESLTTQFSLRGSSATLPTGRQSGYLGRLDLQYTKKLPGDGRLMARISQSREIKDDRTEDRQVGVLAERQVVRLGLPFLLNQPRVVPGTIVVANEARTAIFTEGLDYVVRTIGDRTEIDLLGTGRIADGDGLLIDYEAIVSPSIKFSAHTAHFDLAADYGWIHPYYSLDRVSQDLVSGNDGTFLDEQRIQTAGVRFRLEKPRFNVSFLNELRRHEAPTLAFEALQFSQNCSFAIGRDFSVTAGLSEVFTDFDKPERSTTSGLGRVMASWRASLGLRFDATLSARLWKDTIATDEDFRSAGLGTRWAVGQIEVVSSFTWTQRDREGALLSESRLDAKLIRRF